MSAGPVCRSRRLTGMNNELIALLGLELPADGAIANLLGRMREEDL